MNEEVKALHQFLIENGYSVPEKFEEFHDMMNDRQKSDAMHSFLKEQNFSVPESADDFYGTVKKKGSSPLPIGVAGPPETNLQSPENLGKLPIGSILPNGLTEEQDKQKSLEQLANSPLVTAAPQPMQLPDQVDLSQRLPNAPGITLPKSVEDEQFRQLQEDTEKGNFGLKNPFMKDLKVPIIQRAQDAEANAKRVVTEFQEEITGKRESQGVVGEVLADLSQIAPSFNKGVISAAAAIPKGVGILAKKLDDLTGVDNGPIENYSTYQLGKFIEDKAKEIGFTALDEKRAGFLNSTVPMAFGQMMGMMMTGGPMAAESGLVKQSIAKEAIGTLTSPMAISGALQAAVPEYEAAKAAGKSDNEAFSVFLKNLPGGLTEVIPVANMFTRLNKMTGNGLLNAIKTGAAQGLEEGSQEAVQGYLTNKIAQGSYDPKRDLKQGLLEGAGAGFIVGFIMPGVMNAMASMSTEDRLETKQILANAIKSNPETIPDEVVADLEKRDEKPTEQKPAKSKSDVSGVRPSVPEVKQEESIPVQGEQKVKEEVDAPKGKGVKEEVREPVQQPKGEAEQQATEEGVQPSEVSNSSTETSSVDDRLSAFKQGDIVTRRLNDDAVKTYEIVDTKKDIWKLKDTETGKVSDWNAANNNGFSKQEQVSESELEDGSTPKSKAKLAMVRSINELKAEVELMKGGKQTPEKITKIAEFEKEIAEQEKLGIDPDKGRVVEETENETNPKYVSPWVKQIETRGKEELPETQTKPNKGDIIVDKTGSNRILKIHKPKEGTPFFGKEEYLVDIERENGKKAINMPYSSFEKQSTESNTNQETFGKGFKVLGTNSEGNKVGEDSNGVRAVLKGNVIVSQSVTIIPGRGYYPEKAKGEFLTTDEAKSEADKIATDNGFDSPTHLVNSVNKRTDSEFETVQEIPKETIEKVKNIRELESLTPKQDEQTRGVANEERGRASSETPELYAGEQTDGTKQGISSGSQKAVGDTGEGNRNEAGNLPESGNESTGSTERSDEGRVRLEPGLKDADIQHNFVYPENWESNKNKSFSKKQAYADNIAALEVINSLLDNPETFATDEQKQILSRYNGLGPLGEILLSDSKLGADWNKTNLEHFDQSLKLKELLKEIGKKTGTKPLETAKSSTRNAYYTSLPIIRSIYEGITAGGFTGGKILEGSVGTGRFIGGMPSNVQANSRIKGVDMDVVSALISQYLYPKSSIVNSPLQSASIPSNYYDLFISNIPFGSAKVYDPQLDKRGGAWRDSQSKLHTYFFAKAIDSVRPGGYVAILTTANILDTPGNQSTRDLINKETDFIGAVRLSSTAFNADAGTQVVTDVILLRKKMAPSESVSQISKIATQVVKHNNPALPNQEIQYNEYFKKNPSHIFGEEFKAGGLYNAEKGYTLVGEFDTAKVGEKLAEMAKKFPILERQAQEKDALETLQISPLGRMVSGGIVEKDGKFYRVNDFDNQTGKYNIEEISKTVMPSEGDMPILKGFVDIKKQYFDILAKDKIGQDATTARKELKKSLKDFIKTIKPSSLSSLAKGNKAINRLLVNDPDFFAISALEKSDGTFSDVIEKPIRNEKTDFSKTDVPQEAIGSSINSYGKINLPFIQKILGAKSEQDALKKIKDHVFETPDGEVIETTEYLSGNVVEKLKQAKEWVKVDDKYKKNVEELTKVIPKAIPKEQITFQLGASWIPVQYTQQFLNSIFGEGRVTVRYNKATDDYEVTSRVTGGEYEAIDSDGNRKGVDVVVKAAITKNVPDFYITHSDGSKTPLPKLTQDVRDKAERLQGEFAGLIEADEKTGDELGKLYNEFFNGVVNRSYDGSYLTFPGMQGYELNPHQKDAIMLMIHKMGGMIDHIVGAGKTLVMTVGAIKMKQMGLVNKPMITTMKSVVPGMVEQIKQQFPEAKILAPKDTDFSAANRQRLFAQIANNDWDLVIITHENLGTIPLPVEFESQYIENEISEMLSAMAEMNTDKSDKWAVKQAKALQERIENLRTRLAKLQDKGASASRTDFGTMGIDFLSVDESQQFKNLNFVTKLRNVAGLGTQKGSKRASNLKMVARYLQNMHGGDKGIVFASGTPISNSLVEVYNIFQYMRPSLLKKLQMVSLDQFLKNFALISSMMEKNVAGVIKNKTRLNKFVNVPELASLYSEISDIRGEHNLKLPRPDIKGGKPEIVLIPQSETVKMITGAIYDASKSGKIEPLQDIGINPKGDAEKALGLVLTTLGTKASIDPRLVFPTMKADGGKLFVAADNIKKIYDEESKNKGTQLVFADQGTPKNKTAKLGERVKDQVIEMYGEDIINEISKSEEIWKQPDATSMKHKLVEILEVSPEEADLIVEEASNLNTFDVYNELKSILIKKGIPEKEIAFIHDAPNKKQKEELFAKVNSGEIRILIGSTQKMGTGVNVQSKIAAMHHIDVGWRPSDLEQRNGRGIRRGNEYKEVAIIYYGTENTIDSYRFDLLARKQSGIDSFRAGAKGLREMDFEDGESMTMSEFAAAISGDTRILDLEKLKAKFEKLRNRVESAKRANVLREKRIQDSKRMVDYSRNERRIINELADRIKQNITLTELEEEEKDDKGKVKKVTKVVSVFKGEVDGKEYDTKDPKQREEFYKLLSENANRAKDRSYREMIGTIGGIDVYAKANSGYKDFRIDLGDETVANDFSPVSVVKQTINTTPVTLRTAINATVRDIKIDVEISEKRYKETLSNLAANESVKEVAAKESDVKELEETQAKRDKLAAELKAEMDKVEDISPEEPNEEEPRNSLDDIISKQSQQNADENFESFSGAMSTGLPIKPIGKVKKAPSDNALLASIAASGMTKEQLENRLKDEVKIGVPEIDERVDAAARPAPENMENSWGKAIVGMKTWATQHFKFLSAKMFPREANILREFETLFPWAKGKATQYVKNLVDGMTPNQYKIFSMRIILADMLESIDKGLNMVGPDGKLPFGFTDRDQVDRQLTKYDLFVKSDPRLQRALDMREAFMKEFKTQLIESGLLEENDIESYYHRRIIEYEAEQGGQSILFGKDIADKKRAFQKRRKGTRGLDYSTNFIETEWKVVSEGLYEMEKQSILKDLMQPFDAKLKEISGDFEKKFDSDLADIEKQFGDKSEEYKRYKNGKRALKHNYLHENLPEGYSFYRVSDENRLFWAKTVTQKQIDRAIEQAEDNDNSGMSEALDVVEELIDGLKSGLMVGPKRKQYMIPTPLAQQLDELARNEVMGAPSNLATKITGGWKQLMLLSPTRLLRYNINNFGSDIDRLIQVDPQILKYAKESTIELWDYLKTGAATPQLLEAMRGDVINSGFQVSELADISKENWAKAVMSKDSSIESILGKEGIKKLAITAKNAPGNLWDQYMGAVSPYVQFRENILRYAAYKLAVDKSSKGEVFYWASPANQIRQISDVRQRNAKLARDVFGDYMNLSQGAHQARRFVMPFYSWFEVNMKTHYNLLKNASSPQAQREMIQSAVLRGIPVVAWKMAKAYAMMGLFTAAVQAWNNFAFGLYGGDDDTEKKLREARIKGMQFIVGVSDDGKIISIPIQGAFYDFIDFFGLWTIGDDVERIFNGDDPLKDTGNTIKGIGGNMLNKGAQLVTPFAKAPVELASGQSYYPDLSNPTPINDNWEYVFKSLTLGDEYNYLLSDKPKKESYMSRKFHNSILREFDTEQLSYYAAKKIVNEYHGKGTTGGGDIGNPNKATQADAEYKFMLALRFEKYDEADVWLNVFLKKGGNPANIKQKLKSMNPLSGLSKDKPVLGDPIPEMQDIYAIAKDPNYKPQTHFGRQLTSEDKFIMKEALNYYDRIIKSATKYQPKVK